ncbi:MAG: HIT domain-containing protein [Candidatus Marinimicrobia bacterium]|nr:HIT domain-containing protein [Candidatus Neomarinimicrobiota bacterium]
MDYLWAPWRMEYIRAPKNEKESGCIFCCKPKEKCDQENLILYYGKHVFVIMNRYPYNNGHLMIVPFRHLSDYMALTPEERHEMADVTAMVVDILTRKLHPDGFNIGFNLGISAGAGISEHLHQHVVPRWNGDTNFMPVLGQTKVMVAGLTDYWLELKQAFETYERS